jgi:hypothetical protein
MVDDNLEDITKYTFGVYYKFVSLSILNRRETSQSKAREQPHEQNY